MLFSELACCLSPTGTDHGTFLDPREGILGYIGDDHILGALSGRGNVSFVIEGELASSLQFAIPATKRTWSDSHIDED